MKANRAFFAGILGGLVLTVLMAIFRSLGWTELNLEMLLGTMATRPGLEAWLTGLFLHLLLSGVFAMLYGEVFEWIRRAGVSGGLLVGLIHAVGVGIFLGALLPVIHPNLGETLRAPGFFAINYGAVDVIVFFAIHVVFGVIVGTLYATPLRAGETEYLRPHRAS